MHHSNRIPLGPGLRTRLAATLAFAVIANLASLAFAGGGAVFQPLGFLHPDNIGPVIAYGVSADGSVIVGQGVSPSGFEAFRWTQAGGMVGLGTFPNPGGFPSSLARACSADGSVVVGASVRPNSLNEDGSPFRWTQATGMVYLGSLGGTEGGVARDVSADGSVVVGYSSNANFNLEAFRWSAGGGMAGIGDLPGGTFNSQASGVSGDGTLVVGPASTSSSPYNTSFRWTAGGGITGIVPTTFRAFGITGDGHFAFGDNLGRAARLDLQNGALLTIPHVPIPGLNTDTDQAWAANADGSVVVGLHNLSLINEFFGRAFMWDAAHGTRIIQNVLINDFGLGAELAGWELNNATAVSDDGLTVAGYGFAPSGEQAAWMARLPAPCNADISPPGPPAGDGTVDVNDLLLVITSWGSCPGCPTTACAADINHDCVVDVNDLLAVITQFGACP